MSTAKLLIPMHDATLYELHEATYNFEVAKIEEIYKEVFQSNCPDITAIVKSSDKFA